MDDLPAYRKAKASTVRLGRQGVPNLAKALEYGLDLARRNANTGILDLDDRLVVVLEAPEPGAKN